MKQLANQRFALTPFASIGRHCLLHHAAYSAKKSLRWNHLFRSRFSGFRFYYQDVKYLLGINSMTCLQISVDHRLRKIIKGFGPITSPSQALGNHVKLLHEFGGRLIYDGEASKKAVSVLNMDFTLQLARPESTGGVLVLLLHPDKSQLFERGYLAEAEKCATIKAVLELISVVNDGCLTKDAVSVFDSLPFLTEDYNESETHQKAQETFVAMVKAKKPEVVISCFKTETNISRKSNYSRR